MSVLSNKINVCRKICLFYTDTDSLIVKYILYKK